MILSPVPIKIGPSCIKLLLFIRNTFEILLQSFLNGKVLIFCGERENGGMNEASPRFLAYLLLLLVETETFSPKPFDIEFDL
jgi:hypothetical protein